MTAPRRAVLAVLSETGGHLTAEEIAGAAGVRDAGVHRASVYRTLEALSAIGVVQHVHVIRGTAYHLVDDAGPHPHLQCHDCGAVLDLPPRLLDPVARQLAREAGFELDPSHVALSGRCAACAPGQRRRPGARA
jgi:Fe2+ or Zn2+ uptake regulation protein